MIQRPPDKLTQQTSHVGRPLSSLHLSPAFDRALQNLIMRYIHVQVHCTLVDLVCFIGGLNVVFMGFFSARSRIERQPFPDRNTAVEHLQKRCICGNDSDLLYVRERKVLGVWRRSLCTGLNLHIGRCSFLYKISATLQWRPTFCSSHDRNVKLDPGGFSFNTGNISKNC